MRWGALQSIKAALAVLVLTCMVAALFLSFCTDNAESRANFAQWSNRSARILEPVDYNKSDTCSYKICSWNGTRGIGNLGIGNGSVATLTENTTKDETLYPDYDLQGVVTESTARYPDVNCIKGDTMAKAVDLDPVNTTGNVTGGNETIQGNNTGEAQNSSAENTTATIGAEKTMGGKIGGTPDIVSYGKPYPGILNEYPVEATAVYGKMTGLRMPDGRMINVGIKSIGYEY